MRISVNQKILFVFSTLSVVTIVMGATVYYSLTTQAVSQQRIETLYEFKLRVKELDKYKLYHHISWPQEEFFPIDTEMKEVQQLVGEIIEFGNVQTMQEADFSEEINGLLNAMKFYRTSARELLRHYGALNQLSDENDQIIEKIITHKSQTSLGDLPSQADLSQIFLKIENLRDQLNKDNDPAAVKEAKKLQKLIEKESSDSYINSLMSDFILNLERIYLTNLVVHERIEYLDKASLRFLQLAEKTIGILTAANKEEQADLRFRVLTLIMLTILLTLFLWSFSSRRLSRFIKNQNMAVEAISRGKYDYDIPEVIDDELGDLIIFTKEVAMSLKEKTLAKQKAEKEKQKLENQLLQAQKIESIGILAGGIAHDFNNILASILGFTSLSLLKLPEDNPARKYLKSIQKAGLQAEKLTKQLLAFSRKQVLETKVVNLNDIINDMTSMLSRMIGEDIIMEFRPDPELKNISADSSQIEQVLMNLMVNARDAMPNGGALLLETVDVYFDKEIEVQNTVMKPGQYAQIVVTDNGKGMSAEETKRIFDPFYTTKEKHKGTGLGLSTVYGVVKQHKGYIWVYSEPGKGSSFKIYFPVIDRKKEQVRKKKLFVSTKGSETVLVVDDNVSVCEIVSETLKTYGYSVITAFNAREALQIVDESANTIDLLITDVIMPHMNGRELAEKVREKIGSIKVIFMSGYADNFIAASELDSDSSMAFLSKPVSTEVLTTKVREVLDS
ncbi:ATP-binding protein [Thermodesulfobacteriota bacterium]